MNSRQLSDISAWFDGFVARFRAAAQAGQRNYDLKIDHTRQVVAIMAQLTAALQLPSGERALAAAIAICHDVGRFPQFRDYGTFNDATSVNHAALAVRTLQEEAVLDRLAEEERRLLLQAVALHNVFSLPAELPPPVRHFALLIRDADKLDIWRVLIEYCTAPPAERASAVTWELPETGACSDRVLAEVTAGRMVDRRELTTADDFKLLQLSWVFDLNFAESFRIVAKRGYIETLAGLLPPQAGCREAVAVVSGYVRTRSALP